MSHADADKVEAPRSVPNFEGLPDDIARIAAIASGRPALALLENVAGRIRSEHR